METIGELGDGAPAPPIERSLSLGESWNLPKMRLIALVQAADDLAILGAAEVPLAAP
jgi:hypothetical protein